MLTLPASVRILLATGPVEMRKSIDGLMALVRTGWGEDVYSGHLFAFVSRRGDRVKILTFSRGGFVLYYKRLEMGRFRLPPVDADAQSVQLDATPLAMLLDGIDVAEVKRMAFSDDSSSIRFPRCQVHCFNNWKWKSCFLQPPKVKH